MGKMEQALRAEIRRLARKELRETAGPVGKDVRELKRTARALEKKVQSLEKSVADLQGKAMAEKAELTAPKEEVKAARMSPKLIQKLRKRLGLTQAQLAALLDVSSAAVTFWERGRSRPTGSNFEGLVALRSLGKRDVKRILEEKAPELAPKPKRRTRRKKSKAKAKKKTGARSTAKAKKSS